MDLKKEIIKELHKPARRNYPRRNVVIKGIDDMYYQADLIEVRPYSKMNKGFNYIMTIINCFTKVADAIPLLDKSGKHVSEAMKVFLENPSHKIKLLQTDNGKEYYNKTFSELMNKHNIHHYSTNSEKKASIVERFNRTLKNELYKMFSERGSYVWYDKLANIVNMYNNKFHRSIGMKPKDVTKKNEKAVLNRIKSINSVGIDKRPPRKFSEGDNVRVSKYKHIFSKGYLPNWTNEVFKIYRVLPTKPISYLLTDNKGELLQGGFYGHELLETRFGDVYLVERILKKKKDKVLVRWLGFDKTQDAWISRKDLL